MKKTHHQTLGEEIANAVSHGVMALFGVAALVLLLLKSDMSNEYVASMFFGVGIINLYTMSTLYHALANKTAKSVFRRFDHLSIYILIGASFVPPLLLLPDLQKPLIGSLSQGWFMFIIQWLLIVIGIVFKSIWIKKFSWLHSTIFLAMGWSGLIFIRQLIAWQIGAFWLVLAGGVSYSIGVMFYAFPKVKYFHFIWHLFVGMGTLLQFIAYYVYLY